MEKAPADSANRAHAAGMTNGAPDRNAEMIATELVRLIEREGIRIPRSGYLLRRGSGRVIVEPGAAAE